MYDRAQTPYHHLYASGTLDPAKRQELGRGYRSLNPLKLRRRIGAEVEELCALAAHAIDEQKPDLVTQIYEASPPFR